MNLNQLVEYVFDLEPQLLYVCGMDRDSILVNKTRNGAISLFTDEEMRTFAEAGSTAIVKTLRSFEYLLGPMSSMVIRCEKCAFVYRRYGNKTIVLGFDATTSVIPLLTSTGWISKLLATENLDQIISTINGNTLKSARPIESSNAP